MNTPMFFLHGWGQSRQVWYQQMDTFADAQFLNLPGHGGDSLHNEASHDDWIEAIAEQLPETPGIIVGWSLGGIIAMQLALKYPEKIKGLVLVSTTPSFCDRDDWAHGCDQTTFDVFENGIKENSAKTMGRFFMLMLQGDVISRSDYNQIARSAIDKDHPPSQAILEKGLHHLATTDLRETVSSISVPTLMMHGAEDAIVPVGAGAWLAETLPRATWQMFDKCGHAPFLTHPETFNESLKQWYHAI